MSDPDRFGLAPLAGGLSGETFLGEVAGERTVVRVYAGRSAARGADAPVVDAVVLRLVRGLLPVPEVLEVQRPRPETGVPGLLVTSYLPGDRLDAVLVRLDAAGRARVGRRLGVLLARLACMPLPRRGRFADGDLRVQPLSEDDLVGLVEAHRSGTALASWPQHLYDGLLAVADRAQGVLDRVGRTCLVHGDLSPDNVLVDPATLEVTGLVDWERCFAGRPGVDLGSLLRLDRDAAFSGAVLDAYRAGVPDVTGTVLDEARACDLAALVGLAARRGENPVAEQAHHLLVAVAGSGDLHAVP